MALPYRDELRDASRFEAWIEAGHAGSMTWLKRTDGAEQLVRARVKTPFPWARSAIVCLANYNSAHPRSTAPADPSHGMDCTLRMVEPQRSRRHAPPIRLSQGFVETPSAH